MAENEGDLALRFIQSTPFSGSMADKSRSQFLLKISRVCYIFRHWLPVIWTFKICLEATRSLMNYILLTFYSEMHKETWFSPFTNAMRGMATENMKFKENNSLSMYSELLIIEKYIFSTLEWALLPLSLACLVSISSTVQTVNFQVFETSSYFFIPVGFHSTVSWGSWYVATPLKATLKGRYFHLC